MSFLRSRTENNHARESNQPPEFVELIDEIEKALGRFESTSNHALVRLYKRSDLSDLGSAPSPSRRSSYASRTDERDGLSTQHENEHVFLVYLYACIHGISTFGSLPIL